MKSYPNTMVAIMFLLLGMLSCGGTSSGSGSSSVGGTAESFATLYNAADAQAKANREKLLLATIVYDFAKGGLTGNASNAYNFTSNWEIVFAYAASGAPVDPADYTVVEGTTSSTTYPSDFTAGEYGIDGVVTQVQGVAGLETSDIGGVESVTIDNTMSFGDYGHNISDIPGDWNNCNSDVQVVDFVSGRVATNATATASNVVFTPYTQLEYDVALEFSLTSTDLVVKIAELTFDVTLDVTMVESGTRRNSEEGFGMSLANDLTDISGQASINGVSYTLDELKAALPTSDFTAFCTP